MATARKFRTKYDQHMQKRVQLTTPAEEGRTKPEFKDDCNINKIMARYRKTGLLPESARASAARYGDFSSVPDFLEMQNRIIAAEHLFESLPAVVRKQFNNSPHEFISAAQTPEGRELMVKLGLGKDNSPTASPEAPKTEGAAAVAAPSTKSAKPDKKAEPASTSTEKVE